MEVYGNTNVGAIAYFSAADNSTSFKYKQKVAVETATGGTKLLK